MKRLSAMRTILVIVYLLTVLSLPAWSGEAMTMRLRQAHAQLPKTTVYLDILDTDERPAGGIEGDLLTATLGVHKATVREIQPFETSGEGIAYVLLVDISKSLKPPQFAQMRKALSRWIDAMGNKDRAALMAFGEAVVVIQDFTSNKQQLKAAVGTLAPTDDKTQLHRGLVRAMEMARRKDDGLPVRRIILILSDGQDDFSGGVTQEEVLVQMKEERLPIYAIGFYNPPLTRQKNDALKILGTFARTSGGEYLEAETMPLFEMYARMRQKIRQAFVAELSCTECQGDGNLHRLQIHLTVGTKRITDGLDIRLLPTVTSTRPATIPKTPATISQPASTLTPARPPRWWIYIGGGILVFVILVAVILIRRRRKLQLGQEVEDTVPSSRVPLAPTGETTLGTPTPRRPQRRSDRTVARPTGVDLKFTVIGGSRRGPTYEAYLTDRIIVGRNPACDITIRDDNDVSDRHCEIKLENGIMSLRDLNSTSGTSLNGVPITAEHPLANDDRILVGRTELRVSMPPGSSQRSAGGYDEG